DHAERVDRVPSHRFLAMARGEREGFLRLSLELDEVRLMGELLRRAGHQPRSPWSRELELALSDGYKRLLRPQLETEVMATLKERADHDAVAVFARNLESLLLTPPLGPKPVLGLDPGFKSGVKAALVDAAGDVSKIETIFPHTGASARAAAAQSLSKLLSVLGPKEPVAAIAIGNGTASRETEAFVKEALAKLSHKPLVVMVNEAGASVYSASELARAELPDMDLTHRGAVSIARRLQDPLSELVKVEPQALGVGQYQHDIDERLLSSRLDATVEDAVNKVGVDLNTASPALLSYVAGIGPALAKKIVAHRQVLGRFDNRRQLLDVAGLGRARFEQMAGFLRIRGGTHPLDASAVHPERYPLVARIAKDLGRDLGSLVGSRLTLDLARYVDAEVGEPTLRDILDELARPGRDPRREFAPPAFRDDIQAITDLHPDLELDGVITNVTTFGAFVDLGVHQDGLIHVSRLSDRFVRDPHELVRPGDRVRVRVLEVDLPRKRIALARLH
ncbi:MAG TPA: helix-hairpin-helix domain-containing protein, partial [Myxococcota bacterium]|nr:helix-hairpin-helix domain-containing protein [Myxococcota bacterium]